MILNPSRRRDGLYPSRPRRGCSQSETVIPFHLPASRMFIFLEMRWASADRRGSPECREQGLVMLSELGFGFPENW